MKTPLFLLFGLTLASSLAAQSAKILPERFLRAYDPVTVQFDDSLGPAGGGSADGPSRFLTVSPAPAGEYRWSDARTLQFLPAQPWPALTSVEIRAGSAKTKLSTLLVPPRSVSPAPGSRGLEPIGRLEATFDYPLPVDQLKNLVTVEVRPLPGVGDGRLATLGPADIQTQELETRSGSMTTYRFTLRRPVDYGYSVSLVFRLSNDAALPDAVARYAFETRAPFSLVGMGTGSTLLPVSSSGSRYREDQAIQGRPGDVLVLAFSEDLNTVSLETVKNLVTFEPEIRDLRYRVQGSRLILQVGADRQTLYRMSLRHQPLTSSSGRQLTAFAPSSFSFFLPKADPYVVWKTNEGLAERYGPQYLPLEGRATSRVDLRIYPIDPLDRNFWPFPEQAVDVDESVRPPQPGLEPAPRTDVVNQIRLLPAPALSRVVSLSITEKSDRSSFGLDLKSLLAEKFGSEAPGTYLVGYRPLGSTSTRSYVRLTVTDLSLSVVEEESAILFAVTSTRTGKPVAGAVLRAEALEKGQLRTLLEVKTDANGLYRYEHRKAWPLAPDRLVVASGNDTLVLDPARGLPVFENNHWSVENGYWLSWLTGEPRQARNGAEARAYLLSERPVYKPDETVHLVGWIKNRQNGDLKPYSGPALRLEIQGPDADRIWNYTVSSNEFGVFAQDFADQNLATGSYRAQLIQAKTGLTLSDTEFRVEAYRVPTFHVDLSGPDLVPLDRPFQVQMTADYYSGGRLAGQAVHWTVSQYPYSISNPSWGGYLFSTDERFSGGNVFRSVGSGNSDAELDDTGAARLEINPSAEPDGRARRYVVTGLVSGADRQSVTQSKQVIALPPFVLGMKLPRLSESTLAPQFIVLDHEEKPLAGVAVTVKVLQRQWHSYLSETDFSTGQAQYTTDVVDVPVSETAMVSTSGGWTLPVKVPESGVYVVQIFTRDFLGRQVIVQADTFVPGTNAVSWPRQRDQVFAMTADKAAYDPGDTARVLLKSPYQEARALIVLEGPKANDYRWVDVKGGQATFDVAVTGDMAPDLPLAALLLRGRIGDGSGDGLDLSRPASVGASLNLIVNPRKLQAVLTLKHPIKTLPATKLPIDLTLSDPDGKPLDGQVALWLVDKAVLSLGKEKRLDPLPQFLPFAKSWIRISDLRNWFLGRIPLEEVPGGDGSEEALFDLLTRTTVRKNFKTVPYFNAFVTVKAGKGSVEVTLPDNLTDFAVRAVAVTQAGRFTTAKSEVAVRLPVIAQSTLPRFFRPGDQAVGGGTGRVVEGKGGPSVAELKLEGLKTTGADPSQAARSFVLDDVKAQPLMFPLIADANLKSGQNAAVELYVERTADKARDAFRIELPIQPDQNRRNLAQTLTLSGGKPQTAVLPPEGNRPGSLAQTFIIGTDPRLVSYLQTLPYLASYPFGCSEQQTSKLYPSVLFRNLTELAGFPGVAAPESSVWKRYFEYLQTCQDESGLWSYWPGGRGSVSLTAYILEFLAEAKKAGAAVPAGPYDAAAAGLRQALRSDSASLVGQFADIERVEALAALISAGTVDEAYTQDLLSRAASMPMYSQARLYLAVLKTRLATSPRAMSLLAGLRKALTTQVVAGKTVFTGIAAKWDGFRPVLLTEVRTVAAVIEALQNDQPSGATRTLAIDWLLSKTGAQGWGSTIETVAGLKALRSLLTDNTGPSAAVRLTLGKNTERISIQKVRVVTAVRTSDEAPVLQAEGAVPVTVVVLSRYVPLPLGSNVAAENHGFVIAREWQTIDAQHRIASRQAVSRAAPLSLPLGTVVEEHVRVTSFEPRSFVAIEVPLAAGFEPLNPNLATTGTEGTPLGQNSLQPSWTVYGDDSVLFFFDDLPVGTFDFYFRDRANFEGTFIQPPATVSAMYEPTVQGWSEGSRVKVLPAP